MPSFAESVLGAGNQIGRYFGLVSLIPSLGAVLWMDFVIRGGGWSGQFDAKQAIDALGRTSLSQAGMLIAAAILLGLVINPFQFAATQLLEGYWGGGRLGTKLAAWRINAYRRKLRRWAARAGAASDALDKAVRTAQPVVEDVASEEEVIETLLRSEGDRLIRNFLIHEDFPRLEHRFPQPDRVLPTRLGNILRATEDRAGQQYGLSALEIAGHLSLLSDNKRSDYVRDTRQAMDLAVRLCLLSLILTPITAVLLADDNAWVVLSVAPYAIAYMAYRGAISAAQGYGGAVRYQIDIDRFALYDALHVPKPFDTTAERNRNQQLIELLSGKSANVRYAHKDPPD